MADRTPGPICTSKLGDDWIDDGTGCRSRTSAPGPVEEEEPDPAEAEKAMIEYDIQRIADSPFGQKDEGKKIVNLLKSFLAQNRIKYGDTDGDRGHFEGDIKINKEYSGKMGETILELVHEASHATWRAGHPLGKGGKKESFEDAVKNELVAQQNELIIYKWIQGQFTFSDPDMELRLRRQATGRLKEAIEEHEKKERGIK